MTHSRHQAQREELAYQRRLEREKRTPEQQLKELDRRFGGGVGAVKERVRLHQQIAEGFDGT